MSAVLPTEEPQATPSVPSLMRGSPSNPASASASVALRTANCETRPMLRSCLRVQSAGTVKSMTGAASRVPSSS